MLKENMTLTNKSILVTGAAGFIGANLVMELLRTIPGVRIVGLDSVNDYYDVSLKEYRLGKSTPWRPPILTVRGRSYVEIWRTGRCWKAFLPSIILV